jgi:hypothetical protein
VRPEAVLPEKALCLPTFSHFLMVNKTSLSLSLSLSLSVSRAHARVLSLFNVLSSACFDFLLFLRFFGTVSYTLWCGEVLIQCVVMRLVNPIHTDTGGYACDGTLAGGLQPIGS